MKKNKSPCIDICLYKGPKGWCTGCGMTRQESQKWYKLKPYEQNSLLAALKKRLAKIAKIK